MTELTPFLRELTLDRGVKAVCVGIQDPDRVGETDRFLERLCGEALPPCHDPRSVDMALATIVEAASAPESVPAFGLSAAITDRGPASGGIIGSPHHPSEAAGDAAEAIGEGLSVCAFGGGPGVVLAGDPATAEMVMRNVRHGDSGERCIFEILLAARGGGTSLAIAVCDGSGADCRGAAGVLISSELRIRGIDQLDSERTTEKSEGSVRIS